MICPFCNKQVDDNSQFCPECGQNLTINIDSDSVNSYWGKVNYEDIERNRQYRDIEDNIKKNIRNRRYKSVIMTVIVLAVAIVTIVGLMKFYNSTEKRTENDTLGGYEDEVNSVDESDAGNVYDDLNTEDEVEQIRELYDNITASLSADVYETIALDNGIVIHYDGNDLKAVIVPKGLDNSAYTAYYYYDNNSPFFAYYEGTDSHRFYFYNEKLIRWRYCSDALDSQDGINHDGENTSEYNQWEEVVLSEAYRMKDLWGETIAYGTDVHEYILAGSDRRYISKSELQEFTAEQCRLARNEIYARHGRMFNDEYLQEYFNSKEWYTPLIAPDDFEESSLNSFEIANRDLIVEYEEECGYR